MNFQKLADQIKALKLHPATSREYDEGYQAARHDAWLITQEAADAGDLVATPALSLPVSNTELSKQASLDMQAAIGGSYVMDDGRSFWVDTATVREIMKRVTPIVLAECERHRLRGEHLHKPKDTVSA